MTENKTSPSAEVLTEEDRKLLDMFKRLSEEQRDSVLKILAQIKIQ